MSLAAKTLWVIERNLGTLPGLDDIATACGVSKFHLAHAFGTATGISVMQYLRARRLSEAVQALAAGSMDILELALDCGYASHEAFTRAFRSQFGVTPESVRRNKTIEGLAMTKAIKLPDSNRINLKTPRFVSGAAMHVVGLSQFHPFGDAQGIAAQWRTFMASYSRIPAKKPGIPISVIINMDDDGNFKYVCAAEVASVAKIPDGLISLDVPAQNYAVFTHDEHVSTIGATYSAVWNEWFKSNDYVPADGPSLERHLESFDPATGLGGVEIWIPVKQSTWR